MQSEENGVLLSKITSEQLHWLWEKRIPRGKLTTLDGDPGLGKSLLTLDLAARITTGRPMPDGTPGVQGSVLLVAPEDSPNDTIKPRIEAAGGDPSHIRLLNFIKWKDSAGETHLSSLTFSKHLLPFVETIARTRPTLVIIDPLMTILGPGINASNDQQIRETLGFLTNLARSTNCSFLIVRHLNKGSSGNPLYRGGGSIGIIGTVRTGLLVTQHPADEKQRLLIAIKNNSSEKAGNLIYQVIANERGIPSIQWLGANNYPVAPLLRPVSSLSFERQDILKVLQAANRPLSPKELVAQTGQDHTLLRQLLRRMLNVGDIISPAYGLYTTVHHPSPEIPCTQNNAATPATPATLPLTHELSSEP